MRSCLTMIPAILAALTLAPYSAFASVPEQPIGSEIVVAAEPSPGPSLPDVQPPDATVEPGPADASAAPAPAAPERPSAAPSHAAPKASPPAPAARSHQPEAKPRAGSSDQGPRGHAAPVADPSRNPRRARSSASPEGTAPVQTPAAPGTGAANPVLPEPDPLPLVLIVGMAAVAAVALGGSLWVVLANRRERAAADPGTPAGMPAVDQRAIRRARMRVPQDPILAGMGLDPAEEEPQLGPRKPDATRRRRRPLR